MAAAREALRHGGGRQTGLPGGTVPLLPDDAATAAARRGRWHRGGPRPESPWPWRVVLPLVVLVAVIAGLIVLRACLPTGARVLVWGDSLMVEAQDAFREAAAKEGAHAVELRIWSGTAPCNFLGEVPQVIEDFQPTVAVIAFSGNTPDCVAGRDKLTAYREDVTAMARQLSAAGVRVVLVEAPTSRVDADAIDDAGLTPLGRLWYQIAAEVDNTSVLRAGLAVTDGGRFTESLPCQPDEPCGPDGRVVVRSPDGVHFCPEREQPGQACEVYSAGARRYGEAIAHGVLG
ncbi:MAG: hypothetical protein IRZ08_02830 [Frankia sp.]|nr:hypothetical protein [Frankia sp.]